MKVSAYYNDIDPYVVQWIRNLIRDGLLPAGEVDDSPIQEIKADDIKNFAQCHFFAGIGGWAYGLSLAGWGDEPVWTGSCPCQPFSSAGGKKGEKDEQHLWPAFYELIAECQPPVIFGEQVASKLGREWLTAVRLDLEDVGYAVGAADLCAASVGAPHIRQRLWWVANSLSVSRQGQYNRQELEVGRSSKKVESFGRNIQRLQGRKKVGETSNQFNTWKGSAFIPCADGKARPVKPGILPLAHGFPLYMGGLGPELRDLAEMAKLDGESLAEAKKYRVGAIRSYGNAIVPQVATVFIQSFMEAKG